MLDSALQEKLTESIEALLTELRVQRPFIPGTTAIRLSNAVSMEHALSVALKAALAEDPAGITHELEREFATALERRTASLLTNSGSSANLIALSVLRSEQLRRFGQTPLADGDEVITVAACSPTLISPIVRNRLLPVFVDLERSTLSASGLSVAAARTDRTRAVCLPHILGNPFKADEIAQWCTSEGLLLIEDCRDALGARINGHPAGSFGVFSTFSFDSNK